jgi:DNA invertase Pin-like site-specific DNA recombinase
MRNRSPRGRNAGVKHGNAVLLPENVYEIRRLADEGMTRVKIAEIFGISRSHVGDIAGRRRWKHLPERKGRSNYSIKMSYEETLP